MSDPFLEMLAADDPTRSLHRLRAADPVHFVARSASGSSRATTT